jgi:hypothetical protein
MPYLLVIRDSWEKISQKTRFVSEILKTNSSINIFYLVRKDENKFREKWLTDKVELATSTSGILFNYLLIMLKSPKDLHDGILRRLFKKELVYNIVTEGFLSVVSKTLSHYFATTAKSDNLLPFFRNINSPKIFLIDEFISIRTLDLNLLKQMGSVIYVSQDIASENFDFRANFISRALMYKFEYDILRIANLVIACTERDRLRYIEMGAKNVVFYPNIYPIKEFKPSIKEKQLTICISYQSRWGNKGIKDFYSIFEALSKIDQKIKVYSIGIKPRRVAKNIDLEYYKYIPSKLDYMEIISKSWIGINIGIHKGGSNERKYDYAMAGLVVFSDLFGCRGDLLPQEYTYIDNNDLAAKLSQIIKLGQEKIFEMGKENRKQALSLAEEQREILSRSLKMLLSVI